MGALRGTGPFSSTGACGGLGLLDWGIRSGLSAVPCHKGGFGDWGCWQLETSSSSPNTPQKSRGKEGRDMARCLRMGMIRMPDAWRTSDNLMPPHSSSFWVVQLLRSSRSWGCGWEEAGRGLSDGWLECWDGEFVQEEGDFMCWGEGGPSTESWLVSQTSSWLSVNNTWTGPGCSLKRQEKQEKGFC